MFYSFFKNKEKIYSLLIYFTVFLYSIFPYADLDWGWHYKYGEYLLKTGNLLNNDIFSWTMQGYYWVNHSWAYDPLLYILTNLTGFVGLSLIGAGISLLTFYFIVANFKLAYWKLALLAFFFIIINKISIMQGLRSQVIEMLFYSILMFILIRVQNKTKILLTLPIIFLFGVNLHPDFFLGLGLVGVFLGYYFIADFYKTKKFNNKLFLLYSFIGFTCLITTLINPFSYNIYSESIYHFNSPLLRNVYEWSPIYENCPSCSVPIFTIYNLILLGTFVLCLVKKRSFAIPFIILTLIIFFPTIETRRFLSLYLVITLPFLAYFLEKTSWRLNNHKIENKFIILIVAIVLLLLLNARLKNYHLYDFTQKDYCYYSQGCSVATTNYFVSHPPTGKGFNFYDTGGYLIGKNVPVKLFVDGRMHTWNTNGYSAFRDYIAMYYDRDYKKFNQYNFDWLLIETSSDLMNKIATSKDLGKWKIEFQDDAMTYLTRIK